MGRLLWTALLLSVLAVVSAQGAVKFKHVSRQMGLKGMDFVNSDWRPAKNKYFGACVFDADGDGYLDMLLPNHQQTTEFYWGSATGFRYDDTRSHKSDVHAVAAADMDGDGDEDFIITSGGRRGARPIQLKVYETDGKKQKFERIPVRVPGFTTSQRARSAAFFDMNGNGRRDLLLVNRHKPGSTKAHLIYENRGDGKHRLHKKMGFEQTDGQWFCLLDVDGNGFLDVLLMRNDGNELWMGKGNFKFQQETWRLKEAAGLGGSRACAEFDVDNDELMEVYIARGWEGRGLNDKMFKIKNGVFHKDLTSKWRLPKGGKHSHVTYLDVNNDGRMDAYVSVMTFGEGPRIKDILLYNVSGRFFRKVPLSRAGLGSPSHSREDGDNAVAFDFNNDGYDDLLVGSRFAPWRLYENKTNTPGNNWVRISVGRPRMYRQNENWNKDPWGALVTVYCQGQQSFTRRTGAVGMSHTATNILRPTFGIGSCKVVVLIRTKYIGGVTTYRFGGRVGNREIETGLVNCPGRNCARRVKRCTTRRCTADVCERNEMGRRKLYCPVN